MKHLKSACIALLSLFLLAEAGTRLIGIADMPIRSANPVTGYIPLPDQSGRILDKDWHINNLSMISRRPYAKDKPAIIVSGDSVANGGNLMRQADRIGERMTEMTGRDVFTIADGSWAFKNQINYFLQHKEKLGTPEKIIFILNSADFDQPSSWHCYNTHPTHRPFSYLYYATEKYIFRHCRTVTPEESAELKVPDYPLEDGVRRLLAAYPETDMSIVLYPMRAELRQGAPLSGLAAGLKEAFGDRLLVTDMMDIAREDPDAWGDRMYLDDIHPNSHGAAAMARLILKYALPPPPEER